MLSSTFGILWIYGAFKTTGNSGTKNKVYSWRQWPSSRSLERGPSSRLQHVFSQSELVFFSLKIPTCSELTEVWDFPVLSFQLFWMRQKSCWIDSMASVFNLLWPMILHVNVFPFKLGKETLKPRPHTLSTELQANDCFAMFAVSLWFLPNHSLLNLWFPICFVMFYVQCPLNTNMFYLLFLFIWKSVKNICQ
jgi:hypothetical protein